MLVSYLFVKILYYTSIMSPFVRLYLSVGK